MVTMRTVIALAAAKQWVIYQMNVHNTFLNGDILEEVYMQILDGARGAKPAGTPLELNLNLTSEEYDKAVAGIGSSETTNAMLKDPGSYQRLVGRLLCLTMTRLDIDFVVQVLSQYMHSPKVSHIEASLRVVRCIKGAPGLGLFMLAQNANQLSAYCDSDRGSCLQTRSEEKQSFCSYNINTRELITSVMSDCIDSPEEVTDVIAQMMFYRKASRNINWLEV
ncbi:uncharacterized mitochondrial protein AtMg00810-like [Nicotiana sylvestris]|uniref:uncharacterized mitochondrial protein AtMg00810-like n=1 Tax=Nicotiana sylvestris TaxID=4096 RepID=UPI00388CE422